MTSEASEHGPKGHRTDDRERLEKMVKEAIHERFPSPPRTHYEAAMAVALGLLRQLREREWQPIETAPENEVVILCDRYGNRWTDCGAGHPYNSCGYPPLWWMPLPAPPNDSALLFFQILATL